MSYELVTQYGTNKPALSVQDLENAAPLSGQQAQAPGRQIPLLDPTNTALIELVEKVATSLLSKPPSMIASELKKLARNLAEFSLPNIQAAIISTDPTWREAHYDALVLELSKLQSFLDAKRPDLVVEPPKIGSIESLRYCLQQFAADHLPNSSYEAMQTLQVYGGLLILVFFSSTFMTGLFSEFFEDQFPSFHWLPALVLGSIITTVGLSLLSLKVYDYFRPLPTNIRPLANYTHQALHGRIEPLLGRDDIIEKIFLCWQSTSSTVRQHPLLVGPAGVGKTVIMTEVARRLALGEIPEAFQKLMQGKQVIGGSASLLLPANDSMGGSADVLERVLRQLRPFRKNIILALDEIHALMTEIHYAEALKSVLDTSFGGIPYILAATTEMEYERYIAIDPARARRFHVIRVSALTKEQVLLSLNDMVRRQYPEVNLTPPILDHLYDKSAELCDRVTHYRQPEVAKRILSRAIATITHAQQEAPTSKKLPEMFVKLDELRFQLIHDQPPHLLEEIATQRASIEQAQRQVVEENQGIEKYRRVSEEIQRVKHETISLAMHVQEARNQHRRCCPADQTKEKLLMFYIYYYLPHLKTIQGNLVHQYNISQLNETVINDIAEEMQRAVEAAGAAALS